jgi:hypothetical protein
MAEAFPLAGSSRLGLIQTSPSKLEYRESRKPRLVVGFILLGSIVPLVWCIWNAVSEFLVDPWGPVPRSVPFAYISFEFGAFLLFIICGVICFAFFGVYLICGQHGAIFDKDAETMTLWWRSPIGNWQRVHHLEGFTAIHVRNYGTRFNDNGTRFHHAICFTGPPEPELTLAFAIRSRKKTEEIADQIAMFLGWQVSKE